MAQKKRIDLERGRYQDPLRPDGYPSLSTFITKDRDALIFRRFDRLAAYNLLFLQSELNEIEEALGKLDQLDAEAAEDSLEIRQSAKSFEYLKEIAAEPCDPTEERRPAKKRAEERLKLIKQLKIAMGDYRQALISEQQVSTFQSPTQRALEVFSKYFRNDFDGPVLGGRSKNLLDDNRDLVALAPAGDDRLDRFLRDNFGWFFRDKTSSEHQDLDIFYFAETKIQFWGYVITILVSAILLVGAIACLSLIYDRNWKLRISMIALFTGMFAGFTGLLTSARRAEVFGSSAAYAAVLVVYISGNLGPPGGAG